MGRPTLANTKDTSADLKKVALEMIQTRGYNAFSYQDLAERLKIRKASIHYHFPTKEDLGVGLLKDSLNRVETWQAQIKEQNLKPMEQMQAYIAYFTRISENCTRICPIGALASEWASLPKKMQEAAGRVMKLHQDWLRALLERGRAEGVFTPQGDAADQAQFIYSSIQGALQISRAQNNPDYFKKVTGQILEALKK
jgi:TetR/AcrR family transcriptional regulator, transcriptional repressor for nem operon